MSPVHKFHVLVVAAGGGVRSGEPIPKQFCSVGGRSMLRHSVDTFLGMPGLQSLKVVISPGHSSLYEACTHGLTLDPPVLGGKSRKDSVYNGINAFLALDDDTIILIHDAARPFVQTDDVHALVCALANGAEAATLARPVADTVIYAQGMDNTPLCGDQVPRERLWAVQTPQAFRLGVIKKAHIESPAGQEATDDTSLVRALGVEVQLITGSPLNFKITYPGDIVEAERIYAGLSGMEIRTGSGFDVHRFAEPEVSPAHIRLCGVDIPFGRRLEGHSDADVGLHALTDALLGAMGEADIGTHFPPSDAQFKGMDSSKFLLHAAEILKQKGGRLINADITLICEAPKIGPHRVAIVERIATLLGVPLNRINIKATTTEGLGFTGRREGIAAQAAVNIALPVPALETETQTT